MKRLWTCSSLGVPEAFRCAEPVQRTSLQRRADGVFCVVREDRVDVLAVYHGRRRPRVFEPWRGG
ncbi:MAG: hypothetical protein M5U13_18330 [Thermoanaerobaculia bacterium]|nr:hypothetical protein [Thermoanaerobaculia bacterium]MEB2346943.1 hypothetical protein [Deltaproteobacteria bacterium]